MGKIWHVCLWWLHDVSLLLHLSPSIYFCLPHLLSSALSFRPRQFLYSLTKQMRHTNKRNSYTIYLCMALCVYVYSCMLPCICIFVFICAVCASVLLYSSVYCHVNTTVLLCLVHLFFVFIYYCVCVCGVSVSGWLCRVHTC